jgi:hypothetical protein
MEVVTGLSLAFIFLHNNNWWNFFIEHHNKIRSAILVNVIKVLACGSEMMGFQQFSCPCCGHSMIICFTCKSRFCSACGKKATDIWIYKNFNLMPNTKWQHITFTMPSELWDFFWLNRHLLNLLPSKAAYVIKKLSLKKGIMTGMFTALHTFGRDLKRNVHIHLSVTLGGLTNNKTKWSNSLYFHHISVKTMWRYVVIDMLREQYKAENLKLPPNLKHIKDYKAFNSWLNFLYNKQWVVFLQKPSKNHKQNIEYLGKYLKRPPIGETRIKKYDGEYVTFEYLDHYDNTKKYLTLPVMQFIAKLIYHIHDANFRCIRYFGFLANRVRGKLLPLVHKLLNSTSDLAKKNYISWRNMIIQSFGFDPLLCPNCNNNLLLTNIVFGSKINLISMHKQLACY